jgi:hypothetical protein
MNRPPTPHHAGPTTFDRLEERVLLSVTPFIRGSDAADHLFSVGPAPIVQTITAGTTHFRNGAISAASGGNSVGIFDGTSNNGQAVSRLTDFLNDPRFSGVRGGGFTSVVIDTGLNASHPFFGPDANNDGRADRVRWVQNFAGSGGTTDFNGHGSNVAGAIVSSDPSAPGMASEAGIIGLRVFDSNGSASLRNVEAALQWVIANRDAHNIVSVNLSLGDGMRYSQPTTNPILSDELAALANLGVIVVAAAGNSYYDFSGQVGLSYPAADPNVISVGAVFGNTGGTFTYAGGANGSAIAGAITPFTQRAPWMDVFAPGAPITGPAASGTGTVTMHGTSQAAPIVAGAAVLIQQMASSLLGRRLDLAEFRQLLRDGSATIFDGPGGPSSDPVENDNVPHTNQAYRLLDMVALGEALLAMSGVVTPANPLPNTAPTLTTTNATVGAATIDRGIVLTYDQLRTALTASDAEGDSLRLVLDSVQDGRVSINGRTMRPGQMLMPGDSIVWTPGSSDALGQRAAFTVRVSDGREASATSAALSLDMVPAATLARVYEPGLGEPDQQVTGLASAPTPAFTPLAGLAVLPGADATNEPVRTTPSFLKFAGATVASTSDADVIATIHTADTLTAIKLAA